MLAQMNNRRYDIDWLRVITIGFLLIYHIAIIFQPWAMFLGFIRSEETMAGLWTPMTLLNVWRIPLLFYVSGMGVYFAIRKRNMFQLIVERTKRILLPFVFGMIAIVPLHILLFQKYYNLPLSYEAHASHLWFLGNIFTYVLILAPLFFYLKKTEGGKFNRWLSNFMSNPLGPLAITIFFVAEVFLVKPQVFEMYALSWHGYFLGLIAFFFGFLVVYSGRAFWETVLKWRWLYLGMGIASYFVRYFMYDLQAPAYMSAIESNFWIFGIFGMGYHYLNAPSNTLKYLSSAAYPIYIIHMAVLFAGAVLILPLDLHPMIQFALIVIFTGSVCFFLYEFVIRRVGFLRPLFGLKPTTGNKRKVQIVTATAEGAG